MKDKRRVILSMDGFSFGWIGFDACGLIYRGLDKLARTCRSTDDTMRGLTFVLSVDTIYHMSCIPAPSSSIFRAFDFSPSTQPGPPSTSYFRSSTLPIRRASLYCL